MNKFQSDPAIVKGINVGYKIEPVLLGLVLLSFVAVVQHWGIPEGVFMATVIILAGLQFVKGFGRVIPTDDVFIKYAVRMVYWGMTAGLLAFMFHVTGISKWRLFSVAGIMFVLISFLIIVFKKKAITEYLNIYELCSLVLIMVYLGKLYYTEVQAQAL